MEDIVLPRFWAKVGEPVTLEYGGLLVSPRTDLFFGRNEAVREVHFSGESDCVVLLGEPGSGKSTCMLAASKAEHADNVLPLFVKLGDVRGTGWARDLIEDTSTFRSWRDGSSTLCLYLDGFDEGLVHFGGLANTLIGFLARYGPERIQLRIASRTYHWSDQLERELCRMWGPRGISIMELLPFRSSDVVHYANSKGIDGDDFLDQVRRCGAGPFAGSPVTLPILAQIFQNQGSLDEDAVRLYLVGCRQLVREDRQNVDPHYPVRYSHTQRLRIAERIAALCTLCGFDSLHAWEEPAIPPTGMLTVSMIAGGPEAIAGNEFQLDDSAVKEALNTALFSLGPDRSVGWKHLAYRDFLAAYYLAETRDLPLQQLLSLLTYSQGAERRILPQLVEVAAWTAAMRADVFEFVLEADPMVLLQCLTFPAMADARPRVVDAVLRSYEMGIPPSPDWGGRRNYWRLDHEGIAGQLRPRIANSDVLESVRIVAVHIAAETRAAEALALELVHLALDADASITLRVSAGYALKEVKRGTACSSLRALLELSLDQDPDVELRGIALQVLWPGDMSTQEMLSNLVRPPDLYGTYKAFLYGDPISQVPDDDICLALDWVEELLREDSRDDLLTSLANAVMARAWRLMPDPVVTPRLAQVAAKRYEREHTVFGQRDWALKSEPAEVWEELQDDSIRRRALWEAMVTLGSSAEQAISYMHHGLILYEDRLWLAECYQLADEVTRDVLRPVMMQFVVPEDAEYLESLFALAGEDEEFSKEITATIDRVAANHEFWRNHAIREKMRDRERIAKDEAKSEWMRSEFERLKIAFDTGDMNAWWWLHLAMCAGDSGAEWQSKIEALPGWTMLESENHEWFCQAASRYLREFTPQPDQWVADSSTIFRPDFSGYRAFRYLLDHCPEHLEVLGGDVWRIWGSVLVAFPIQGSVEDAEAQRHLVSLAYPYAAEEMIETAIALVMRDTHGYVEYIVGRFSGVQDDMPFVRFSTLTDDRDLAARLLPQLLSEGVRRGISDVLDRTVHIASHPSEYPDGWAEQAILVLWRLQAERFWPLLWRDAETNRDRARAVGYALAEARMDWEEFEAGLSDQHVADMYVLLNDVFPPDEDEKPSREFGHISPRQEVGWLKGGLLRYLSVRGTEEACTALQSLMVQFPTSLFVAETLFNAQQLCARNAWQPVTTSELKRIARSPELRLIQSADDLLDVVLESIGRLQVRLTMQQPPLVAYLWNELPDGTCRPKSEESLSDFIKDHLDQDLIRRGVLVNREVVNRKGDEVDILVQVKPADGSPDETALQVVVETKGRWHPKIWKAMESQLLGRYMANNGINRGIYVAGWFDSDRWDTTDDRYGKQRSSNYAQASKRLQAQAAACTGDLKKVQAIVLDLRF